MKKRTKRVFALLLAIALCVSAAPAVFAYEGDVADDSAVIVAGSAENGGASDEAAETPGPDEAQEPPEISEPVEGGEESEETADIVVSDGAAPALASAGTAIAVFKWNDTEYSLIAGENGSADGLSWTCDASGGFTMTFTSSGTLEIVRGNFSEASATIIGGGAGGDSASTGKSGAGGGAGEKVTTSMAVYFLTPGRTIPVTVGAGGKGGGSWRKGLADDGIAEVKGSDGGVSNFGGEGTSYGIYARGGTAGGGAASVTASAGTGSDSYKNGNAGSDRSGGSGAVMNFWAETRWGNFRPGTNWSCWYCGNNRGANGYGNGPYDKATAHKVYGGAGGASGGGKGGDPDNDCPNHSGEGRGANGAANTGGGGAYCTWEYGTGYSSEYNPPSRKNGGYAGAGGDGGSGIITLTGKVKTGSPVGLKKVSSDTSMTGGNSCYSLAGAVYGLYSDHNCEILLEMLTTDDGGNAATSKMYEAGTYYIKEITASPGYMLDPMVYTVKLDEDGSASLV